VVSGVTVHVAAETTINQEHGPAAVGAKGRGQGDPGGGWFDHACCIKVEETDGGPPEPFELEGVIESLPREAWSATGWSPASPSRRRRDHDQPGARSAAVAPR